MTPENANVNELKNHFHNFKGQIFDKVRVWGLGFRIKGLSGYFLLEVYVCFQLTLAKCSECFPSIYIVRFLELG